MWEGFFTRFPGREKNCLQVVKFALFAFALMGCGDAHRTPANEPGWQSVLQRFEGATAAVFSLSFYAAPPEGTTLRLALHEGSAGEACDLYQAEAQEQLPDFWFLALTLNHPDEGAYRVVPEVATAGSEQQVSARLSRVIDGKKARSYDASDGTVVVEAGPHDIEEWQSGANFQGKLALNFPAQPLHQVECRGDVNVATGESSYECTCADDTGKLSICSTDDGRDCCIGTGPPVAFNAGLSAAQCPWMCIASDASLYRHCLEIQD
jgi:hypothetical protein